VVLAVILCCGCCVVNLTDNTGDVDGSVCFVRILLAVTGTL